MGDAAVALAATRAVAANKDKVENEESGIEAVPVQDALRHIVQACLNMLAMSTSALVQAL